ncbi:LOW QUALITY PROTEIN: hypothetical protein Cgig2_003589 [Carnegiea gigantea]|uniref:Reverse transcriptase zinc-binding domain-containing protein n=1 Tax=Carnegiea gigantea TaxID=171969 RepID=A0A9Q1GGN7_9CARY|nr:LOW QUALITY PROTEIN: hypothetical protein Cgig2_003589 [Carnegiea gigantea]
MEASQGNRKRRRFEIMWAEDQKCEDIMSTSRSQVGASDAVQNCVIKIERCLNSLLKWNAEEFGYVQRQIGIHQNQLKTVRDGKDKALILAKVRDWRRKEEVSWWIPRPNTFWVVTPFNPNYARLCVGDLIDGELGVWKEDMVDVEATLNIPVSQNWPPDRPIWHFSPNGDLTVKSAYHVIMQSKVAHRAGSSGDDKWKAIWGLCVPPRIKLFAWWSCIGALPTSSRLAHRIPNFSMRCNIIGRFEESDLHALVDCPIARAIWESSKFALFLADKAFASVWDLFFEMNENIEGEEWKDFISTAWAIWNSRNKCIFGSLSSDLKGICEQASQFVHLLWERQEKLLNDAAAHQRQWIPLTSGNVKLNFDGAKLGDWGHGWGAVAQDSSGNVLFAGMMQGLVFLGWSWRRRE